MQLTVKSIKISDIACIHEMEIKPDILTVIEGRNGSGKTTILNALRSVTETGHDPSLLKKGSDEGSIRVELSDGITITETITPEKTTRVVRHPQFGKISKTKEWMESVINSVSFDPARFLVAKPSERVAIFLQALPIKLTADQLEFVPVEYLKDADLDEHALSVIGNKTSGLYGVLYKERTEINRLAKDKRSTAIEMERSLPERPADGNWSDELARANNEYRSMYKAVQSRVEAIKADARAAVDSAKELHSANETNLNKEESETWKQRRADLDAEIKRMEIEFASSVQKLSSDTRITITRSAEVRDKVISESEKHRDEALKATEAEMQPKLKALTEEIARAKSMVEAHAKAESARELVAKLNTEATKIEAQSEEITGQLKKLEALKSSLLANLPIDGMEICDGQLIVSGLPFDRINDSEKHRIAVEIMRLNHGDLGLMVLDRAEIFDSKSWASFKSACRKSGLQIVAARVTDSDLTVKTEGVA